MKRQLLCSAAMLGLLAGSGLAAVQMDAQNLPSERREHHPYVMNSRVADCASAVDVFAAGLPFDETYTAQVETWFYLAPQADAYFLAASSCHPESIVDGDTNIAILTGTDCTDAVVIYDADRPLSPCVGGGGDYPDWYASIDASIIQFQANTAYWLAFYDYNGVGGDYRITIADDTPQVFECPVDAAIPAEPDACGDFMNALDCGSFYCGDLTDGVDDADHYWMTVPDLGGPLGGALVTLNVYADDTPGQEAYTWGLDPAITVYGQDTYTCDTVVGSDDDGGTGFDSYLQLALQPGIYMVSVDNPWGTSGPYLLTMDCAVNCWEDNGPSNATATTTAANYMDYMGEANAFSFAMSGNFCNIESVGPGTFSNGHTIADLDGGEQWFDVYQPVDECVAMLMSVSPAYYPQPEATCTPLIGVAQDGSLLGWFALDASEGLYPSNYNNTGSDLTTFVIDAPASCEAEVMVNIWYENLCVEAEELPVSFSLAQNHPNPFNPTTTIEFSLSDAAQASLTVFNMAGEKVATLVNGMTERGAHSVTFDASNLSSGVYFYTLNANGVQETKKMVLMK